MFVFSFIGNVLPPEMLEKIGSYLHDYKDIVAFGRATNVWPRRRVTQRSPKLWALSDLHRRYEFFLEAKNRGAGFAELFEIMWFHFRNDIVHDIVRTVHLNFVMIVAHDNEVEALIKQTTNLFLRCMLINNIYFPGRKVAVATEFLPDNMYRHVQDLDEYWVGVLKENPYCNPRFSYYEMQEVD